MCSEGCGGVQQRCTPWPQQWSPGLARPLGLCWFDRAVRGGYVDCTTKHAAKQHLTHLEWSAFVLLENGAGCAIGLQVQNGVVCRVADKHLTLAIDRQT